MVVLSPYGMLVTCLITRAHLVPRCTWPIPIFTFVEVGLSPRNSFT
jgi:hypothetical protein